MTFFEKLDLLMTLTHTTNHELALVVGLDASFISRLRHGQRRPSTKDNYPFRIAYHLTEKCASKYQQTALSEAMRRNTKTLPHNTEEAVSLVDKWLWEDGSDPKNPANDFIQYLTKNTKNVDHIDVPIPQYDHISSLPLFGLGGKRSAVKILFQKVLESNSHQTIHIYTDENFIESSPQFSSEWFALLHKMIYAGHKIKLIHFFESLRNILETLQKWLPLYSTGAVESRYYPKTRDSICKRTLIIAPASGVVVSSSIGNSIENASNFIFQEQNTIASYLDEFNELLNCCLPFATVYTRNNHKALLCNVEELERTAGNTIVRLDNLPTITLPAEIAWKITETLPYEEREHIATLQHRRVANFEQYLKKSKYTVMMPIPDVSKLDLKISCSEIFCDAGFIYTKSDYIAHLSKIIDLMRTYENFNIIPVPKSLNGSILLSRENKGVMFVKNDYPSMAVNISDDVLANSFTHALEHEILTVPAEFKRRSNVIKRLERFKNEISMIN